MKSLKIHKILKKSFKKGNALRFRRRHNDFDEYGYVVGMGDEWVLFHVIAADVMTLNGYMAVRIEDIEKAQTDTGFFRRALSALGESPLAQPGISLTDIPSLLQTANERFPLLNLHFEVRRPGKCYIGRVEKVGEKRVHLWEITPEAQWRETTWQYPLDDLTLVEFGDGYTNALWMLGQKEWLARNGRSHDEHNAS